MNYTLGLDIGIASIGWAVLRNNDQEEPYKIENLGVRVFNEAEHPKTGASLALPRRQARGMRRCIRRKRHRKERIKSQIEEIDLMSEVDMEALFSTSGFQKDVYTLRAEALDRMLKNDEWVRVLIHLAQRRGYRSNSRAEEAKEKENGILKDAIRSNQQLMHEKRYRTVGEMFCKDEKFHTVGADGKIWRTTRNTSGEYRFTVTRQMVAEEVQLVFDAQRKYGNPYASEEFQKKYADILFSQRNFDEGPGAGSPYQKMDLRGYCIFEKGERRAFKACYTFEYFKLLQDINHIRICSSSSERKLMPDEREKIIALAMKSDGLNFERLRKELQLPETVKFNLVRYDKETVSLAEKGTKFLQMQSYHKLRKAMDPIQKGYITTLNHDVLDEIGTILSLYKADTKRIAFLKELGLTDAVITALLPLSFSKAGNLSLTAMQKLIPLLESGKNYNEACSDIYGDFRGHVGGSRWKTISLNPDFLKETQLLESITNPVVLRAISQTCKVVSAIVREYGSPQCIRLELAREMSKNFDQRRKAQKDKEANQKLNEQAMEHIREIKGDYVTGQDLIKWKLYQEQDGICLYSGTSLEISRLFEPGYVEIDHIVPYSISFDDSYRNKVLVLSSENQKKGNRLPLEYMEGNSEKTAHFETLVNTRIRDYRKKQRLLKKHLTEEDISGFRSRNLIDTQYISRIVYNLFHDHLEFAPSQKYAKKPVYAVNGAVTSYMRKRLGLKKNRADGDLHHAMDAAVVAVTTDSMIQRISNYAKRREWGKKVMGSYVDPETGELLSQENFDKKYAPTFPEPWPQFRKELEARLGANPCEEIMQMHLPNYETDEEIRPVFVSQMPHRNVTGPAHKETIWSGKRKGMLIKKVPLTELKLSKDGEIKDYYNANDDLLLYTALKTRLNAFNGDGKKAFAEPFYKPKKDGSPGPVVNKVKIQEITSKNVEVNHGIAGNGSMVRVDVFRIEDDGYYFVPIYTADTVKKELPNQAVIARKPCSDWKTMNEDDFLFSLYPGDLLAVESSGMLTLRKCSPDASGEPELHRKNMLLYYVKADIGTASWTVTSHDRKYQCKSLGIKRLQNLEKYEVDLLGRYHKVNLPEKRQSFR